MQGTHEISMKLTDATKASQAPLTFGIFKMVSFVCVAPLSKFLEKILAHEQDPGRLLGAFTMHRLMLYACNIRLFITEISYVWCVALW